MKIDTIYLTTINKWTFSPLSFQIWTKNQYFSIKSESKQLKTNKKYTKTPYQLRTMSVPTPYQVRINSDRGRTKYGENREKIRFGMGVVQALCLTSINICIFNPGRQSARREVSPNRKGVPAAVDDFFCRHSKNNCIFAFCINTKKR